MWLRYYPLKRFSCFMKNIQLTCKRPACSGGRNCQSGPQSRLGNQPGVHGDVNIYVFNKTGKQFGSRIGLPTRKCEVMQYLFIRILFYKNGKQYWNSGKDLSRWVSDPSLFHNNNSSPGRGLSPGPLHCERPWSTTFFYKTIFVSLNDIARFLLSLSFSMSAVAFQRYMI